MIGIAAGTAIGLALLSAGYLIGRNSAEAGEIDASNTINDLRRQVERHYKEAEAARWGLDTSQGDLRKAWEANDLNREEIIRLEALRDSLQDQIKQLEADAYIKAENAHHRASEASKKGWETRKAKKVEVAA